jgi:hypothetical protein
MTIPSTVADQPQLPPKAGTERVRAAAAPKDQGAQPEDGGEDAFSDVLSKLNGGEAKAQPEKETQKPQEHAPPAHRRRMRHVEIHMQMARQKGDDEAPAKAAKDTAPSDDLMLGQDAQAQPSGDDAPQADPSIPQVKGADAIAALLNAARVAASTPAGAGGATAGAARASGENSTGSHDGRQAVAEKGSKDSKPAQMQPSVQAVEPANSRTVEERFDTASLADGETTAAVPARTKVETARPDTKSVTKEKVGVSAQEAHFAPVTQAALGKGGPHDEGAAPKGRNETAGGEQMATAPAAAASSPLPDSQTASALSPTQQIADKIRSEVPAAVPAAATNAAVPSPDAKPVLKILQIQLQPVDLGTVTVRMELKDAEIKLHVQADRPETAEMLRSDQDTLSKLLRSAGYSVDPSSIRVTDADRTGAATQAGQQGPQANLQSSPQSHQSQQGFSERHDRQHRSGAGRAGGGEVKTAVNRNEKNETTNRSGGDLYI